MLYKSARGVSYRANVTVFVLQAIMQNVGLVFSQTSSTYRPQHLYCCLRYFIKMQYKLVFPFESKQHLHEKGFPLSHQTYLSIQQVFLVVLQICPTTSGASTAQHLRVMLCIMHTAVYKMAESMNHSRLLLANTGGMCSCNRSNDAWVITHLRC